MPSPQALSETDRRIVALWAADCAERVLPLFEAEALDDGRARDGIARARAFGRGELTAAGEILRRFEAGRAAKSATSPAAIAAARAAGQASGVAHMGAHALGAAAYAAKAADLANPGARDEEVRWQLAHMSGEVRAALRKLPALGTDSAGPLGAGLLANGVLGEVIRKIQAALEKKFRDNVDIRKSQTTCEYEAATGGPEQGRNTMKYMLIMRSSAEAVAAFENTNFEEVINAMGAYNESMIKAGVLLAGDGLTDAKEGFVVDFSAEKPIITDGPYGEINELFNGFWIIEASSKEEAAEWASRAPLTPGSKLEVRRITDESDFADYADNEFIQKEKEWRADGL